MENMCSSMRDRQEKAQCGKKRPVGSGSAVMKPHGSQHRQAALDAHNCPDITSVYRDKGRNAC